MPRQGSVDLDSADRPFDNIINFRDVGRTVNHFAGAQYVRSCPVYPLKARYLTKNRILKEGVLFRSARVIPSLSATVIQKNQNTDQDLLYSSTMPQNEINADWPRNCTLRQ